MQLNPPEFAALSHPQPASHRLLIVDDHPVFREGLQMGLQRQLPDMHIVLACGRDEALADLCLHPKTDMVIVDQRLCERSQDGTGLDLLVELGRIYPSLTRVLISGTDDASLLRRAAQANCAGYLHKSLSASQCAQAVQAMLNGSVWFDAQAQQHSLEHRAAGTGLTLRQMEVLQLLAKGMSNKDMARLLNVGERTIKAHLTAIFEATSSSSRTQALLEAGRRGWVRVSEVA
jgi:two-component system, NarL family, nitrate/nitrite response regulator NarL